VRLLVESARCGKSIGLNHAMKLVRGHIVVFTDANVLFSPGTIPGLLQYFTDPRIGLVTGHTQYVARGKREISTMANLHTSIERGIKAAESRWGYCVRADGGVFAMRRSLFRSLRHDDINDLVPIECYRARRPVPLRGRRLVRRASQPVDR